MPRSPPPAAINSMAATMMVATEMAKVSDLPLRNHSSALEAAAEIQLPPTPPDEPPSRAGTEPVLPSHSYVETPSSTVVEFGDRGVLGPSAAMRAEYLIRENYSRSRSRSGTSEDPGSSQSKASTTRPTGRSQSSPRNRSSPRSHSARSPSASSQQSTRSPSGHRGAATSRERGYSDRIDHYLQSMPQYPPGVPSADLTDLPDLTAENQSLQKRIAGLQKSERELLEEKQKLDTKLRDWDKQYEKRRQKWKQEAEKKYDEYEARIREYEARIREYEARIARQEDQLAQFKCGQGQNIELLSDDDITTWFSDRGTAWQSWAEDFGHRDASRLQTGLHPLQMLELCGGVKNFVRLTDKGELPPDFLSGAGTSGTNAAHILLHAMLADFIVSEAIKSPFWVFGLLSGNAIELESPCIPQNSMSPVGFRMDLAMWNNVAPLRSARLPQPMTAVMGSQAPLSAKKPHRLITTVQSLSIHTTGLASLPGQGMPTRQDMENLFGLINEVQQDTSDGQKCLSQIMRVLAEGGLNLNFDEAKGEKRQLLAEARKNYASKLKDRFLSGPARFLLEDQDAVGIMRLERRLLDEFDMALRFSCKLWSRPHETPVFKSLEALSNTNFWSSSELMGLCKAQGPIEPDALDREEQQQEIGAGLKSPPPAYYDGQSVLLVLQPAVEGLRTSSPDSQDNDSPPNQNNKVWAKAQVLLTAPRSAIKPLPPSIEQTLGANAPTTMASTSVQPATAPPAIRSPVKRSPRLANQQHQNQNSPPAPQVPTKNSPDTTRQQHQQYQFPPPPQQNHQPQPHDSPATLLFKVVSLAIKG